MQALRAKNEPVLTGGGGRRMDPLVFPFIVPVIVLGIGIVLVLYLRRWARVEKISSPYEGATRAYFEAIRNVDPVEGIDYIVSYIKNPKWGCPLKDLPDFLFAMAERTDGFGEAARKKISELGLLQNVQNPGMLGYVANPLKKTRCAKRA